MTIATNKPTNITAKFLTAEELSKLLRIPQGSIYKFAKEGLVPGAFRLGKHWRFREDVVGEWIERQTKAKKTSQDLYR